MAKKQSTVSAFDEIITQFGDDADKEAFIGLAEKYPQIKEYGLRQSDYSRYMNESKIKIDLADEWNTWKSDHWDDEAKMTKQQKAAVDEAARLKQENEGLESRIAAMGSGGDDMTFEQLEQFGKDLISKNGIVTKVDIDAKQKELEGFVKGFDGVMAKTALTVSFLNQKHDREFGEPFDPDEFVKEAAEKGANNLKEFYENQFVAGKRQERVTAQHVAEIERIKAESAVELAKAKEQADAIAARIQGMGSGGMNPSDDGSGSVMGAFQKQYLKLDQVQTDASKVPDVPLGDGGVAAFAAAKYRQDQLATRS